MERALKWEAPMWGRRLLLFIASILVTVIFIQLRLFSSVDLQIQDWFIRTLPAKPSPQQITLIDIDERSLAELGPWPWPKPVVAQLMKSLRNKGAKLQVWDVYFADSHHSNKALAVELSNASDIVLGQVLVIDSQIQPPPQVGVLRSSNEAAPLCSLQIQSEGYLGIAQDLQPKWVGHLSATPDSDGRLRRLPAFLCDSEQRNFPQLAVTSAQALTPHEQWILRPGIYPLGPSHWLERGGFQFPLDVNGNITIPYARPHTQWAAISASQLLNPDAALPSLEGHIVLIGASALGISDVVSTPRHPTTPGVSIHGELVEASLFGNWLIVPQSPVSYVAVLSCLILLLMQPVSRPVSRLAYIVGFVMLGMLIPFLAAFLGHLGGYILPIVAPSLGVLLYGVLLLLVKSDLERRRSNQLSLHLRSFLPTALAREIASQSPSDESLGRLCQGVLLTVRVRGLERWTSSVDSLQALGLAHAISTVADKAANTNGGALEHVYGEMLLIAWPIINASNATAAIETARTLLQELNPLLLQNESMQNPMSLQAAIEGGAFLIGLAGPKASRRVLLLGPVADIAQAMLPFCEDLAAPLLIGPQLAQLAIVPPPLLIGKFLLPDQQHPKSLYRVTL